MKFLNSESADLSEIFRLYDQAIEFQKRVFDKAWLPFEPEFIETEIREQRHWKIVIENEIACVFSIAFADPLIWKELGREPAIYIHRIAVNPKFRGRKFVPAIVEWARGYAASHGAKFVRMDTWGDNQKLIDYYTACGFEFLGVTAPNDIEKLPKHYENITLSLFEMKIETSIRQTAAD